MDKSLPLVSAIIIFYNEERFIEEAILSVIDQTYTNWELIIVDDGSKDKSPQIAKNYAAKYPGQICYLEHDQHKNLGMSASRNLGIKHTKGKYIAFLDGDDVWLPQKLEQQVSIMQDHQEAKMVYGPLQLWYSWTGNSEDQGKDQLWGLESLNIRIKGDNLIHPPNLLSLFIRHKALIPAGILIEKQVILDVGGYEDIFKGNYEDTVLLVKVCLKSPVYVSNECWYKYRQHPEQSSKITKKAGKTPATRLFFLKWVKQYFMDQQVKDKKLWKALKVSFFLIHNPWLNQLQHFSFSTVQKTEASIIKLGRNILPLKMRDWLWRNWENLKVRTK